VIFFIGLFNSLIINMTRHIIIKMYASSVQIILLRCITEKISRCFIILNFNVLLFSVLMIIKISVVSNNLIPNRGIRNNSSGTRAETYLKTINNPPTIIRNKIYDMNMEDCVFNSRRKLVVDSKITESTFIRGW